MNILPFIIVSILVLMAVWAFVDTLLYSMAKWPEKEKYKFNPFGGFISIIKYGKDKN